MAIKQTAVKLRPINQDLIQVTITGTSSLVQHQWDDKAVEMMRQKQQGVRTKNRDARNPEAEFEAATYRTTDGEYGIPVTAIKASIIGAAHKDIGIEKTLVRKSLFIRCPDANGVLPMSCSAPTMREDLVRVGAGSADLRYRPEFKEWELTFVAEVDADLLKPTDLFNLVDRAGFGVGICEHRPEKGGSWGRFKVVR
jgi:hypothetical protein